MVIYLLTSSIQVAVDWSIGCLLELVVLVKPSPRALQVTPKAFLRRKRIILSPQVQFPFTQLVITECCLTRDSSIGSRSFTLHVEKAPKCQLSDLPTVT